MAAAGGEGPSVELTLPVRSLQSAPVKPTSSRGSRIPSVGDLAEKEGEEWTVFSGSQNLPTALNDPSSRELDLFTRTWGSYFVATASLPSSPFPTIEVTDFLRYLRETSSGRKIHRAIIRQLSKDESGSCWSPSSPGDFPPLISQLQQDGRNYDVACVPRVFMQRDFSLKDPPTFLEVLPLTQLLPKRKRGGREEEDKTTTRHQSLKLLHEKLTHYLDVIEVHLAYQISQRSDVFFSTLSSQQELQLYIMQVRQEVVELRQKLRSVGSTSTRGALQLFSRCRCQRRYQSTYDKLRLISTVQQAQPTIQSLLRKSDFVGALELITTTQEVLQEHLHGVRALRHLGSQLAEMENAIEKMMEADLIDFAVQDIRHRLEVCRDPSLAEDGVSESEEHLGLVVLGLLRQGKFHFLAALRENLLSFLKAKVKGIVSGYLQGKTSSEEEPASLAECMRGMEFDAWLDMLSEVFDRMLQCQSAVQGCVGVIADVCARSGGMSSDKAVSTPTLPLSIAGTPTLTPNQSLTPGALPVLGPAHLEVWSEGGGVLEGFEAAQEAEDRLAQFTMDEELSDAWLGGEGSAFLGVDEGNVEGGMEGGMTEGGREKWTHENTVGGSVATELRWEDYTPDVRWEAYSGTGVGVDHGDMVTKAESTCDPEETNRLEHSTSAASFGNKQPSAIISIGECQRLLMECQTVTSTSCQLVHARCAKILDIRARAGLLEGLVATDFLLLVHRVEDFVRRSAVVTGIHCPNLRIALQSQAKNFLENFHDSSRKKMSLLLESERWKQVDVPAEIQGLVNKLEAGILVPGADNKMATTDVVPVALPATKFLVIHGENFAVVGIVQVLVKELVQYCHYADNLPVLINEVMTKLIDIIKFFNTRTCDLVLGGGVVDAVGLKKITARHLAIMMRCLQAVRLLIPDLRRHFELRLDKQQHILLSQFDSVVTDFSRHCEQINSKFSSMMDVVIQNNMARWEVKQPVPSPAFKTISKKIVQLHDNLVDILPPQHLEALFARIELTFRSRLKEQLTRLGITNNGSTKHGIVNLELRHCQGVLSSLDSISAFGSSLFDVWTAFSDT